MQLMQYISRPSRGEGKPTLKGCYWFGEMEEGGEGWGRFVLPGKCGAQYVGLLGAVQGVVAFDAKLCEGGRHTDGMEQAVASVRVKGGCAGCGGFEGGEEGGVLIPPVPLTTSDVRVACRKGGLEKAVVRCEGCLKGRWCEMCFKWWCESCVAKTDKVGGSLCRKCVEMLIERAIETCAVGLL